ncbi:MAG: alpha/beta fold hydrolase, partial [Deltaproteobacteria bacterium]
MHAPRLSRLRRDPPTHGRRPAAEGTVHAGDLTSETRIVYVACVRIQGLAHGFVSAGDVRLHYVTAGEGPLVVLLHGFPEFWYAWRHQIGPLADAGYKVVVPDLRGYGSSDKPTSVDAYAPDRLVADVRALVDAFGGRAAAVVGHDWGGVVAYLFAHAHPERLDRVVVANAPHPAHFFAGLTDPAQLRRSWYVFFFQLPKVPEWYSGAFDHARLRRILRTDPVRREAFTE